MMIKDFFDRIKYWMIADRLGPDMPLTHWRLFFKSTMVKLCQKKFNHFDPTAEFRPGAYAFNCSTISIGKRVVIRPGCVLHGDDEKKNKGITIEDDVLIGLNVHIYTNNHRFDDRKNPIIDQGYYPSRAVVLKKGSWIGSGVIILQGVTVGKNAVVGAGSIVTRNVTDYSVVAGNPARIIK